MAGDGASHSLWSRLSPDERSLVRKHKIIEFCSGLVFSTCMPYWNSSYLALVDGDTALMARHYGISASIISIFEMFTSPFVASLSDTVGRKYLSAVGRIGWIMFFAGHRIRDRSLPFRLYSEVVCWGVVQAGVWNVFSAQHSDIFGERPSLSAEIKADIAMYQSVAQFMGPWLALACTHTVGSAFSQQLVSIFTGVSMAALLSIPETLMDDRPRGSESWVVKKGRRPAHRKPFSLSTANPFANIALLFGNGPGLRSLATATAINFSVNEIWSTQGTYRMGVLGWRPQQVGYFESGYNLVGSLSQGWFVQPMLRRLGPRLAFECGALASALAYGLQSASVWGRGRWQQSLIYIGGTLLLQTFPAGMPHAGRAMVVAQGIAVNAQMGRGQLNAAYGGMGEILAVITPLVWGYLFSMSQQPPAWLPRILRWGKAGHCLLASAVFLACWRTLKFANPDTLFLDDDIAVEVGEQRSQQQQEAAEEEPAKAVELSTEQAAHGQNEETPVSQQQQQQQQ